MATIEFDDEELAAVAEAVDSQLIVERSLLDFYIDQDRTPETLDDLMAVAGTQQDRIAVLENARTKLEKVSGD